MAARGRQAEVLLAMATGPLPCMRVKSISGPHQPRHGSPTATQRTTGWPLPLPGPAAMHPGMAQAAMGKPCTLASSMNMSMSMRMQRRMA